MICLELQDMWSIGKNDSCDPKPQIWNISPVAMAYAKTSRRELIVVLFGSVVYALALGMQSYVAQALFLNDRENIFGISNGYYLVAMMTLSSIVAVSTVNYVYFTTSRIGANVRSLTMTLVFDKALKLSSASRQHYTAGEVLTLMSVDAERVFTATLQCPWKEMAPPGFHRFDCDDQRASGRLLGTGSADSLKSSKSNVGGSTRHSRNEVLRVGGAVSSLNVWRNCEPEKWISYVVHSFQVVNTVMLFLTPTLFSSVTLGLYVLLHSTIDIIEAFTLIAMVSICRTALFQLPQAISSFYKAKISLSRIDLFLESDYPLLPPFTSEDVPASPSSMPLISSTYSDNSGSLGPGRISFRDASFRWPATAHVSDVVVVTPATMVESSEQSVSCKSKDVGVSPVDGNSIGAEGFCLQRVNLELDRGALVMVVGRVGAGKSSLVNAILGEMPRTSGVLEIGGRVAYVSQDTWIRNATLRGNILFEQDYDPERYAQVLEASQLAMDLNALPNGDSTEIGERGINLSGGQKARVAIARAMYRTGTDVLILDDPLSAVDPHVAHAIFEKCIVGMAGDQTRLLVLNSHYDLLSKVDLVAVLDNGTIVSQRSYEDVAIQFPDLATSSNVAINKSRLGDTNNMEAFLTSDEETESGNKMEPTGQLILDEDRVRGSVAGHVYKTYPDTSTSPDSTAFSLR
ncbi:hypothetical protein PC129_g18971 [Phytophthora cactorum]|uniref:ABC transporter domain-containing protein n=4 Tax=Phytophthora cactorum TaxID=29920 RepID=A0A8T1BFL9_9STRA|nr:hypothetical protein Pcac1_g10936 [Phytophthora cactorum]KAG2801314.1 hypothetical protein PC112_g20099 [Phytophthora cactorum]KAG2801784.1 hypothetical protein PC111_g19398 [Phytophthora cactorum]KAG2880509.1 hypothetical protein PC114_g22050 [Phytophthora cactorum]KAG2902707.1 hypothetical protein PC115_g15525 [Phytophthora cactorum]